MRIVGFVEGAWPPKGGLGLVAVPRIFESIAARGCEATLLVAGSVPWSGGGSPNCAVGALQILTFRSVTKWAFSLCSVRQAFRLVRQADVVFLHSLYSFPVLLGFVLARRFRKQYVVWPLGVLAPFQRQVGSAKKWIYDRLFARRILSSAAAIAYTAEGEHEEARSCTPPVPFLIIPHGIDIGSYMGLPERGFFRAGHLSGFSGPVVTFLGRLNAKKGLEILVEAFAVLVRRFDGNIRLAVVGPADPPGFEKDLKSMVRLSSIEAHTVITGPINGMPEKLQAFVDTDCFALPSIAENFCFSLFEAMACRTPVVVSETINFASKVESFGAGLAVRRTPESFADAIETILQNPAQQRTMGAGGRRLAEAYSWPACGERIDRAVQCIVSRQPFPFELTHD